MDTVKYIVHKNQSGKKRYTKTPADVNTDPVAETRETESCKVVKILDEHVVGPASDVL